MMPLLNKRLCKHLIKFHPSLKSSVRLRCFSTGSKDTKNSLPSYPSSSSILTTASSILSNLQFKIASSLTSSLPLKDRERLIKSLNIGVSDEEKNQLEKNHVENETKGRINHTIGEAVAAAVANEATKTNVSLTNDEKEKIWKMAEQATLERIQHDLMIKDLKRQDGQQEKTVIVPEDDASSVEDAHHHHPILGPTLADLGYKRIHLASAQTLSAIPIWEKQRIYRHDRAKVMAHDKLKSMELGLPGVISLHESVDGTLSILDGQHRVGMLALLQEKSKDSSHFDLNLNQILVEVFPQSASAKDTHAQDIFTEINKAEPVKLVDMPGVAKVSDRRIINEASSILQETYPEMFKPSQRCRSPHLNVDNLRDAIFAAGILHRNHIKSQKALVSWILEQNEELGKKYQNSNECPSNMNASALKKAKQYGFYLGLDSLLAGGYSF